MSPGIIIPVVLLGIVIPVAFVWAKKTLKDSSTGELDVAGAPSARLTSNALRELPVPPWRVVYEIGETKLSGIEHVVVGPPGVFAVRTSMDPLPLPPTAEPDAHEVARAAIVRGALDDALARSGLSSDRMIVVHWGVIEPSRPAAVDVLPGVTAVDGRRLGVWAASLPDAPLSPSQVDLAWQTTVTAIGRPDPLG